MNKEYSLRNLLRLLTKSSIQKRIFFHFFSFVFICIILGLLIFSTVFINRFKTSEENHLISRNNEAKHTIEFLLQMTDNTASLLASNRDVITILNVSGFMEQSEYKRLQKTLNTMLINIISIHEYIDNIYIAGNGGEFLSSYWETDRDELLERYEGYSGLIGKVSQTVNGQLITTAVPDLNRNIISFIRPILFFPNKTPLGYIIIDLNYTFLREIFNYTSLKHINEMLLVINRKKEQIFSFPFNTSLMPIIEKYPILLEKNVLIEGSVFNRRSSLISSDILYSDWTMVRIISLDQITSTLNNLRLTGLAICFFLLIFSFMGSYILSNSFTKPIIELNKRISQVRDGNLEVQVEGVGSDEIGQLQMSFNSMVRKVNKLMQTTLQSQKKKSDLEFEILQAQINPHFLYNTLDSIKWLAVFHNNTNIADMVTSLINLLKYNISKKETLILLRDELEILKDYEAIQKYRFGDDFSIIYDIEPESENCHILKFLLQPLIENAIFHGFQDIHDMGIIRISSKIVNHSLFLTVKDNGQGLKESSDSKSLKIDNGLVNKRMNTGIGIKNVSERIELYFGRKGGFSIENDRDGGVLVTIKIPVIREQDKNFYIDRNSFSKDDTQ